MILDGVLQTRFPDDKHKFLKSEWRDRYCILEVAPDSRYVINVYKSKKANPSQEERGALRQTIVLSSSSFVASEDIINKSAPFFQYAFTVSEGGIIFKFSSAQDIQRNAWIASLNKCIKSLKPESVPAPTKSALPPVSSLSEKSGETDMLNEPPSLSDNSKGTLVPLAAALNGKTNLEHKLDDADAAIEDSQTSASSHLITSNPDAIVFGNLTLQGAVGGPMEPLRKQKYNIDASTRPSQPPFTAPKQSPIKTNVPNSTKRSQKSSSLTPFGASMPPGHLDSPAFASKSESPAGLHDLTELRHLGNDSPSPMSTPFWMNCDNETAHANDGKSSPYGAGLGLNPGMSQGNERDGYNFSSIISRLQGGATLVSSSARKDLLAQWTPEMVHETDSHRQKVPGRKSTPSSADSNKGAVALQLDGLKFGPRSGVDWFDLTATRAPPPSSKVDTYDDEDVYDNVLRKEIAALTKLNNELNETIEQMKAKEEDRESQIRAHCNELEGQLDGVSRRCRELEEENRTLMQENSLLKEDMKELQLLFREKEESVKLQKSELLDIDTYRKIADTLTREKTSLETELNALRKNLTSSESVDTKTQKSIKLLLDNIKYMEKEKSECLDRLEEEKSHCEELTLERDELTSKLKELIRRYKRCDTELRTLQSRVQEEVQEEVATESNRMYELQEECEKLRDALRNSQQEMRIQAVEMMQLQHDSLELKEELEKLSKEREQDLIDSLRAEIESLTYALNEKTSFLDHTSSTIIEKDTLVAQERARLDEMQCRIEILQAENADQQKEFQLQLEANNKKLRKINSELTAVLSELKDSERRCAMHKERVLKLEEESTREIDSRSAERQTHMRSLREVQEALANTTHLNDSLQEKVRTLEEENSELLGDIKQLKKKETSLVGQMEGLEASLSAETKALQKVKQSLRKLESELSTARAEQEKDKMEYEEKLLKIKSTSGQRKQSLAEAELRLSELTRLWHADQAAKDELSHSLRSIESKYEDVNIEIQKMRELRKREVKEFSQQIDSLNQSLFAGNAKQAELEKALHNKQQELDSANQALTEYESSQKSSEKSISELKKWDMALRSNLKAKEQELEDANTLVTQLQQEANVLNTAVMEKQEAIGKYKKRISDLKEMVLDVTRTKEKAENALSGAVKANQLLERELSELTASKCVLDEKLVEKCFEMENALAQLTKKYEDKLAKKTEELEDCQEANSSLKRENKVAISDLSISQAERVAHQQAQYALEESMRTADSRIESVNRTCRSLQEELDASCMQVVQLSKTVDSLQSQLHAKNAELARMESDFVALRSSSEAVQTQLSDLQILHVKAIADMTSLQQHCRNLEEEVASMHQLQEELTNTQNTVHSQKLLVDELREEKVTLSQTCRDSSILVDSLTRELEEIRPRKQYLEQYANDAKQELAELRPRCQSQQSEIETLIRLRNTLQDELNLCKNEIVVVSSQLSEQTNDNKRLQEEIERVRHNTDAALESSRTNMDSQITALYTKVSTLMSERSTMESVIKRAAHHLSEAHLWSFSDIINCGVCLTNSDVSNVRMESGGSDFIANFEKCVEHICSDMSALRKCYEELQKEIKLFENKLQTCDSDFNTILDDICGGICGHVVVPTDDRIGVERNMPMNALSDMVRRIVALSGCTVQQLFNRDEAIRNVASEMSSRLSVTENDYESRLNYMESAYEEKVDDLQNVEMELCRCMREKDDMEKLLRHHISPEEFERLFHVTVRAINADYDSDVRGESRPSHRQSSTNVDTSDHYIDDFDDVSSYQGLRELDESDGDMTQQRHRHHSHVAKESTSVNRSSQLNISDLSFGVNSINVETVEEFSYQDGGKDGSRNRSQHGLTSSRRSRGASVPLSANRLGALNITSFENRRPANIRLGVQRENKVNGRLNAALNSCDLGNYD